QTAKQDQSRVTVGFEYGKAIVGIGNVQPYGLPTQMSGEGEESDRENNSAADGKAGRADENNGEPVEQSQHRFGTRPKQQRSGFDPDQRVIFSVLMGIDGVVADNPGD